MDFEKYQNKIPYPDRPHKPALAQGYPASAALRAHADAIDKYNSDMISYRQLRDAYDKESMQLHNEFKVDAIANAGLTGHPKADKAFEMAWDDCHDMGKYEVSERLIEYANLLLD